jgi:hypothetical protein
MTTFDDDMARLHLSVGTVNVPLRELGLEWPPPERIYLGENAKCREARNDDSAGYIMRRISMSVISDEDRAEMTNVVRGAEYEYERHKARRDG